MDHLGAALPVSGSYPYGCWSRSSLRQTTTIEHGHRRYLLPVGNPIQMHASRDRVRLNEAERGRARLPFQYSLVMMKVHPRHESS
jgi:hypothetical protein